MRQLNRGEYVRFNYKSLPFMTMVGYNKHDYYLRHCKVLEFNKHNLSEIGRSCHQEEKFSFSRLFPRHQGHRFLNIWALYIHVTAHRNRFLFNNQPDALIKQNYSVIKLYMFRVSSLPIIRSSLLYIRHWYVSCRFMMTAPKQSQDGTS